MTKSIAHLSAAAAIAGVTLSLTCVAHAQDQGRPPPGNQGRPGAHGWGDPEAMKARMEQHRQHRAQLLHDALGLRGDQESAWQAFLTETKPAGEREGHRFQGRPEDRAQLTTPERLDRMAQRMSERQAAFGRRAAAIKRLYAALDPRQQKTFDALQQLRGHGMGMGGGMGRGMGRGFAPPPPGERG